MCLLFDRQYAFLHSKDRFEQLREDDEDREYILQLTWVPLTVGPLCQALE